ncbi:MAG: hemolysin family protein, partial [Sphaerochaetaceae bacterium]|nr:hemolysin family protein [Sphaerochaetaceae bacterium]
MNSISNYLIIQIVILLIHFFFTAVVVAIGELTESLIKSKGKEDDEKDKKLLEIVADPKKKIRSLRVGRDLTGYVGASLAILFFLSPLSEKLVEATKVLSVEVGKLISFIIIVLCYTLVMTIFSKLLPKRIAQQRPYEVMKHALSFTNFFSLILTPFTFITYAITKLILKLFHMKTDIGDDVTEDDIRQMVDAGEETGTIEADEKEMIQNIFEFNDISVDDIMTRAADVIAIDIKASEDEIHRIIKKTGKSRFPVIKNDNLNEVVGILNARDFLLNYRENSKKKLADMLRPAYFVPESIKADQLFSDMQKNKVHISIVIDEYGETCGIVTLEDLLEEIVGNIYDEFDEQEAPEIEKLPDGRWKCSGTLDIDDLEENLGIEIDTNGDFDTLGGLIFSCLHTIPEDGQVFTVTSHGLVIDV